MLAVDSLGKRYGSRWVFRRISFQLGIGDRLAVLGSNGSGKSTLLKVISGLAMATEGSVSFAEGDLRCFLGFCGIEQALYPHLSVEEHLELAAELRGCDSRTDELLDKIGLAFARGQQSIQLSTGMKSRLRLALAIQAEPKLLLLDEPGASLDESGRALIEQIADEQAKRGCLIFATNDPGERRLANLELKLED